MMGVAWILILLLQLGAYLADSVHPSPEDVEWYRKKQEGHEVASFLTTRAHVLRLGPGEDVMESLWKYARVVHITAASVVTAVGSLTTTNLRYANQEGGTSLTGHFEIVSLVGQVDFQNATTIAEFNTTGSGHLHLSCSDEHGVTIGGHLLPGNIVYTTAEITLLSFDHTLFRREVDDGPNGSGYEELTVYAN